jgi:glycine/D-amino acid oxidase-like deaminating enzyme
MTFPLADTDKAMSDYTAWLGVAQVQGLDTRLLDATGVAVLMPQAALRGKGSLCRPPDRRAEPWVAVPELARAAVAWGVRIVEN